MASYNKCSIVRLKSFHNKLSSSEPVEEQNNFWKLIGLTGEIISENGRVHSAYPNMGEQVLVRFHDSISEFGINCHNDLDNSLWIFINDLELS